MICYNHHDKQAVAICKNCFKAICEKCAIPDENGFACSDECHQEIILHKQIDKSKMVYGLRSGRVPIATIFLMAVGVPFGLWGLFDLLSGSSIGLLALMMGTIFVVVGIISYINMKKTGIKS